MSENYSLEETENGTPEVAATSTATSVTAEAEQPLSVLKRQRDDEETEAPAETLKKTKPEVEETTNDSEQATTTPTPVVTAAAPVEASKPIVVQNFTYEEVTKIAAAQAAAANILPVSHASSAIGISLPPLSQASSASVPSVVSPSGDSEIMEVSKEKVGQIIGSKGAVIQDMQTRTGAKIYVKQDINPCQVQINGTPQQVKMAADLVRRVIIEGPTSIHVNSLTGGPTIQVNLDCPQALVGRIIGSAGGTIKELQSRSGAKIQIDQSFPDGVPRKVQITGTQTAVTLATQLVSYVMEHGPALPGMTPSGGISTNGMGVMNTYGGMGGMGGVPGMGMGMPGMTMSPYGPAAGLTGPGGQNTHVMEVSKPMVGRIIGRGGETINMLQTRSGTRMQIDQGVIPCKINITGSAQNIGIAMQLITELVQTGAITSTISAQNPNPQGGMPGMNPYGMPPGGPGQFPGYPQSGGFGGMPQQQPPYGQMPPQQQQPQYGGYPGQPGHVAQPQQYQQMQQQYPQVYGAGPTPTVGQSNPYGQHQHQPQPQMHQYGTPAAAQYPGSMAPHSAPVAQPTPASNPWSEHKTDDGNTYWYNSITGKSQWERPV